MSHDRRTTSGDIEAEYRETELERLVVFRRGDRTAAIAQNVTGYAMLAVRTGPDGGELERYYGLDMALDHVAELLECTPEELPLPEAATDLGM